MERRQLYEQLQRASYQRADGKASETLLRDLSVAKSRVDDPREDHAPHDAPQIEER